MISIAGASPPGVGKIKGPKLATHGRESQVS